MVHSSAITWIGTQIRLKRKTRKPNLEERENENFLKLIRDELL